MSLGMPTRSRFSISFTEAEEALVARIDFQRHDPTTWEARTAYEGNLEPIPRLLSSLSERNAIPAQRVSYWTDPEFRTGRLKGSREQLFARHGTVGEEAFVQFGFLPTLRYFLFGAQLPAAVIAAFEDELGDPRWVSLSDAMEHGRFARKLAQKHGIDPSDAEDEFFKLALDLGLWVQTAMRIGELAGGRR
tara:strand:+ start:100433 stop:101005 length:573 start_codon:yes stop_codon:yes gene_type:complete